jgi:RNA polymerase sigma-70 factor (ECF subfamily)
VEYTRAKSSSTDASLVYRTATGDKTAFDELIRRYRTAACLVVRRYVSDPALAEDAVQEALLVALKNLSTLRDADSFGPWLMGIAIRRAKRIQERRRRESPIDDAILANLPAIQQPCEHPLGQLLEDLPPPYREAIVLHHLEGWSLDQISAVLGVPVSTVKWRLFEGRKRLRGLLQSECEE